MLSFLKHSASQALTSLLSLNHIASSTPSRYILNYHNIDCCSPSSLFTLNTSSFLIHIKYLCSIQQPKCSLASPYPRSYKNELSLTFDDGYLSTLLIAAPLLEAAGIPFTVFITKSFLQPFYEEYLNVPHLLELASFPNCTIGSHCLTHTPLNILSTSLCLDELISSRHYLEDLTNKPVTQLSYPHGASSNKVMKLTHSAGYSYAYTTRPSPVYTTTNNLLIPRFNILSYYTTRTLFHIFNNHLT